VHCDGGRKRKLERVAVAPPPPTRHEESEAVKGFSRAAERRLAEFRDATGMAAYLTVPPFDPGKYGQHLHPLCEIMNSEGRPCPGCRLMHGALRARAMGRVRPEVADCHLGLRNFAVIVSMSREVCGVIEGGRVLVNRVSPVKARRMTRESHAANRGSEVVRQARVALRNSQRISEGRFSAALGLLECDSSQIVREARAAGAPGPPRSMPVTLAMEHIRENFRERLAVGAIACVARVSEGHLARLFKRETGQTVVQFVNHLRVEEAKRLLVAERLQVAEVAFECGFESIPHFNRLFRRMAGMPPLEFRARCGE